MRTVVTTTPAAEALEEASAGADLVVVGAGHLDHAVRRLLTHSVAEDVARQTGCPVAIVRDRPGRPDAPVVVGVDGGAASRRALQWAVDDCATSGRSIVAVNAWHIEAPTFGVVITDDDVIRMERAAGQVLERTGQARTSACSSRPQRSARRSSITCAGATMRCS